MTIEIEYPDISKERGKGFWLRPAHLWASRRKIFRRDASNEWRYAFHRDGLFPQERSVPIRDLIDDQSPEFPTRSFRCVILADTGEGDRSQYALVPVIRHLNPTFIVINGDVAYPAGSLDDFEAGFFQPYRGLDVPIWATPGNHEYYSPNKGQEFFEIFCTRKHAATWAKYNLQLFPQPGTYWELSGIDHVRPVVILGVDSGQTAKLDGHIGEGDPRQHDWLHWRLTLADKNNAIAVILFHIPALLRSVHQKSTALKTIHALTAEHPSVRAVICGHEHNYQYYSPQTFARYLSDVHGVRPNPPGPHYFVAGASGASLSRTDYKRGTYPEDTCFPAAKDWPEFARWGRKIVAKAGLEKTLLGRIVGLFEEAALSDADAGQYLSFLVLDVTAANASITPVFLNDVQELYCNYPDGTSVRITDRGFPADPAAVTACMQSPVVL
jgi:hypothetical protein